MTVLDTDVLSTLMRPKPDPVVTSWLDALPAEDVWTTSITVFEIAFGLALLAPGRRRQHLEAAFSRILENEIEGRVLNFDTEAAREASARAAVVRRAGRPVDFRDVEIAGIVASRGARLATRNARHFSGLNIPWVNPWASD